MQLHQLKPSHKNKKPRTRVGRGGKRGTYSGRGVKGQKARAGRRIRPAERDFIQRLPKMRGFKNQSKSTKPQIINLRDLEKKVTGTLVNPKTLAEVKLVKDQEQKIKILASGEIKRALTFQDVLVTKQAREKIEAAGGRIESR